MDAEISCTTVPSLDNQNTIRVSNDNALIVAPVLSGLLIPRTPGMERRNGIHLVVDNGTFKGLRIMLGKTDMSHPKAMNV